MSTFEIKCSLCNGPCYSAKDDWIPLEETDDGGIVTAVHKDCYFDEPRPEAPDTSDDGDGFSWEKFWEEAEARGDAERERFDA